MTLGRRSAALAWALVAAWLRSACGEEWRLSNSAMVRGKVRIAEVELYSDARCSKRIAVKKSSTYVRPLPAGTDFLPSLQHSGEDCWGKCNGRAGRCAWCGAAGACCKQGSAADPAECRRAVGFHRPHHECVAVGGGAAKAGPAARAFDDDLETSLEVQCNGKACMKGSLVIGAELAEPNVAVHCAVLLQPAEHLKASGQASAPAGLQLTASRSALRNSTCPGICRSGKFVDRFGRGGPCSQYLTPHGACTKNPAGAIDCTDCQHMHIPSWQADMLPLTDTRLRFGGAFIATRLRDSHGGKLGAVKDAGSYVVSRLAERPARVRGNRSEVLHRAEDCWDRCGQVAGQCAWCGEGGACCRQGFQNDPDECKGAVGFVKQHHECVAAVLPAEPALGQAAVLIPVLGGVLGGALVGLGYWLRLRREGEDEQPQPPVAAPPPYAAWEERNQGNRVDLLRPRVDLLRPQNGLSMTIPRDDKLHLA